MKNLGQFYKIAREKQKLSISEVSMATKISPKVLQAIEDGDENKLPATTFLKGFLRSYANYLKLDPDEALRLFNEEKKPAISHTPPPAEEPRPQASVNEEPAQESEFENSAYNKTALPFIKEPSPFLKWFSGLAVVLLLFIVIGVNKIIEKYQREGHIIEDTIPEEQSNNDSELKNSPKEEKNTPTEKVIAATTTEPEKSTDSKPQEEKAEVKSDETKPAAKEKNEVQAITKPSEAPPAAQAQTPPPTPPVTPAPTPEPPKTADTTTTKPLAEEAKNELTEAQKNPPAEGTSQEVILEALDKVDVSIKINDGPFEKVTLSPDQVHTIKLKGKVALELSDGGAVNIIHNGRDRGVPGDLGKPKKVTIP